MIDNSDDYDFTPSASSNLRSLFESSASSESSSLIYTAPKQPKSGDTTETKNESTKAETSVIYAQIVQTWKLTDGKYTAVGKHGFAIIGSSVQPSCEIILYKEKRNVTARAKIYAGFEFFLKKDDFASFYDSSDINWLIKFNNHEDCLSVINHVEKYGGKVITVTDDAPKGEKSIETHNVDDSSNTENKTRADILSRIAKMGQSILPSKTSNAEQEILESAETASTSSFSSEHREHSTDNSFVSSSLSALSPSTVMQPPRPIQNVPTTFVMTQSIPYDPLNIYVAENRAQNTEIRMNLTQISEKLNCIMKLVDTNKSSGEPDCDVLKSKVKVSELRMENLMKELATVQNENIKLKQKVAQQNDVLKNEQQSRVELTLVQEQEATKIEALEREINLHKSNNEELSKIIETQKIEIEELQKKVGSYQDDIQWKGETERLKNVVFELEQKLRECEERSEQEITTNVLDEELKQKGANFTAMLKEEMNWLYSNIVGNISLDQENISKVNGVIAQNIKVSTLKIIQNFQQLYDNQQEQK